MKTIAMGVVLAALLSLTPAVAKDKRAEMGASGDKHANADAGRGGLKEWPVSKTEADWSGAAASSSTGASSGTSGSDDGKADQK
ncbi:MAG: hypothetical protein K2Y42_07660 [Hyphomicrobium sp.]|jgi:hypothetical protein|uniref:hypothetical protein n=1 Tax=Hyphomicrobium sp. TaxID=82 RepID=UPI0025B96474|nr:hypothetical protein [Hyphomicrobium sp.]MBX9862616.1 hypothetical protein [Hyphomicrobium sp.]